MTHTADTEPRYTRWADARDLRECDARPCPRVVAGKRCRADHDDTCSCVTIHDVLDHARIWYRPRDGGYVLTAEPYHLDADQLWALLGVATTLRLDVAMSGHCLWNPPHGVLVVLEKAP